MYKSALKSAGRGVGATMATAATHLVVQRCIVLQMEHPRFILRVANWRARDGEDQGEDGVLAVGRIRANGNCITCHVKYTDHHQSTFLCHLMSHEVNG